MIAVDLGLFKLLANQRKPLTLEEMAVDTGADPVLLGILLVSSQTIQAHLTELRPHSTFSCFIQIHH